MRGTCDNAKGFGDYTDGFSPQNSVTPTNAVLPGCSTADDYTHPLGEPAEGRLAAALGYLNGQACPTPPAGIGAPLLLHAKAALHKPFWRENQLTRRR